MRLIERAQHANMAAKAAIASVVVLLLLTGVFFRFYHLDEQGFWGDEGATAHYVAGYLVSDIIGAFRDGRVLTAGQLHQFEIVSAARGPSDAIRSLAIEDAGHPPLYYVLGQEWLRFLGGSPTNLRLLTALLSLLLLPAAYWLAAEVFDSRTTGWIATCLIAVSPFWVEYAQQAREYALWAALTAASSALLLRALRTQSGTMWVLYSLSLALSLYCFFFSVFVVLAHVGYVCIVHHFRVGRRELLPFALCVGAAVAIYAPWITAVSAYLHSGQNPYYGTFNAHAFIYIWMVNLAAPFFDLQFIDARLFSIVVALIVFIGWCSACLLRYGTPREKTFVGCLALAPLLVFASKSTIPDAVRYAIPTVLAIHLTVAFAMGRLLKEGRFGKLEAAGSLVALIVLGVASCAVRSQQHTWWISQYGAGLEPIAAIVNSASRPLLVTDDWVIALDTSAFLNPGTRIALVAPQAAAPLVDSGGRTVFLYTRCKALPSRYAARYDLLPMPVTVPRRGQSLYSDLLHHRANGAQGTTPETWLWRIVPKRRESKRAALGNQIISLQNNGCYPG